MAKKITATVKLQLPVADVDSIRISLASPEKIRSWSHGEVNKAQCLAYSAAS
jgi:DNA-directed RNA polymerase subunit beta'